MHCIKLYPINWLQALKMKVIGVNLVKKLVYLGASCEKCIRLAESQSQKPCKVHASTCLQEKPYLKKKNQEITAALLLSFDLEVCFVLLPD